MNKLDTSNSSLVYICESARGLRLFRKHFNVGMRFSCDFVIQYNRTYLSNVAVSAGCPENFFYFEDQNLCYHMAEMNLQWQSASQYCRALDSRAHLIVINTAEEQQFVANGLAENSSKYKPGS